MTTDCFTSERLHEFASRVFQHFGIPALDAEQAADILVLSDLRGIDSHGIARLRSYVSMLSIGRINPQPNIRIMRESLSTATVDGDNGLGLVVGPRGNLIAMEKADHAGTGWVAVKHTNHFG
ncbi:MAG TPA: Ldh family oxidoreductase, partial [Planctomycetaceae bacterium]|nr:Ldh family oxidoreductase [Planctomycetaceae bacterium]